MDLQRFAIVLVLVLAALLCPSPKPFASIAQEKAADRKGVLVHVIGEGTSVDEATKDAFRKAVGKVLGEVVDTVTLVENGELIRDKVLLYSKGFISKYEDGKPLTKNGVV